VAVTILLLTPIAMLLVERGSNPQFDGVGATYTWLIRTLIEGGSPYDIKTGAGYALYYLIQASGVAVVATLTAGVTSRFVGSVLARGAGMGEAVARRHIVICGWSSKGPEILRELHAPEVKDRRQVVVLADLESFSSTAPLVAFVRGNPTSSKDLTRAGIERADCAIILADESNRSAAPDDIDARTLLTTLAVESVNPSCYTCVEVIRSENRPHFQRTKADELVVSAELAGALLAGSATTHGLSRLVSDLVTHPQGTEFYRIRPPVAVIGMAFTDALKRMKDHHDSVVVAVFDKTGRYELNPPSLRYIKEDDELLVIANSIESLKL
jgi:voltage-gated potassium channel